MQSFIANNGCIMPGTAPHAPSNVRSSAVVARRALRPRAIATPDAVNSKEKAKLSLSVNKPHKASFLFKELEPKDGHFLLLSIYRQLDMFD